MRRLEDAISAIPELVKEDLEHWIDGSLVGTQRNAGIQMLTDSQYARVRLICTLRYDMDMDDDFIPIVLDLLDQLHEARQQVHELSQAILKQEEMVKLSILEVLSEKKMRRR